MIAVVERRYPSPNGTSRETAARFAHATLEVLSERRGPTALRLDLSAMLDPGRAWLDELLNRQLLPYCRTRGIPITVLVGSDFARDQLQRTVDQQAATLVEVNLVGGVVPAARRRSRRRG